MDVPVEISGVTVNGAHVCTDRESQAMSSGKVKYKKMNLRHIFIKRSSKRKRQLRAAGIMAEDSAKKVRKQMLPYG